MTYENRAGKPCSLVSIVRAGLKSSVLSFAVLEVTQETTASPVEKLRCLLIPK